MSERALSNEHVDATETSLRRGVIAVILRPQMNEWGKYTGRHLFYCLDAKQYQHGDRMINPGVGLVSETYEEGEYDPHVVIARSIVEEIGGLRPGTVSEEEFVNTIEDVRHRIVDQCTTLGTFEYKFNYKDPSRYLSEPDTCADVVVLLDDDRNLPLGPIQRSEEVEQTRSLSRSGIQDPCLQVRSGYDIRHLLETPELLDILNEGEIEIAEHDPWRKPD